MIDGFPAINHLIAIFALGGLALIVAAPLWH